jgi:hypothetical protein
MIGEICKYEYQGQEYYGEILHVFSQAVPSQVIKGMQPSINFQIHTLVIVPFPTVLIDPNMKGKTLLLSLQDVTFHFIGEGTKNEPFTIDYEQ